MGKISIGVGVHVTKWVYLTIKNNEIMESALAVR